MRWRYNILLIVFGLPLFGMSLMLAGLLFFGFGAREGPSHLIAIPVWFVFLTAFSLVYKKRANWLKNFGIYQSWGDFEAYVKEDQTCPEISSADKLEFLTWAGLTQVPPGDFRRAKFRRTAREIYQKIQLEIQAEKMRKTWVQCLIWYASGKPIKEGMFENYEDTLNRLIRG